MRSILGVVFSISLLATLGCPSGLECGEGTHEDEGECIPDEVGDDNTSDDDDTGDDDTADDDAGDVDNGDDDSGDDDDEPSYELVQELTGTASVIPCPDCDYVFDITYTTIYEAGTCVTCGNLSDGTYTLAYDSDYDFYGNPYSVVLFYIDYQTLWYFAYQATANYGGHDLYLFHPYNDFTWSTTAYWDISGETMTRLAIKTENN